MLTNLENVLDRICQLLTVIAMLTAVNAALSLAILLTLLLAVLFRGGRK